MGLAGGRSRIRAAGLFREWGFFPNSAWREIMKRTRKSEAAETKVRMPPDGVGVEVR